MIFKFCSMRLWVEAQGPAAEAPHSPTSCPLATASLWTIFEEPMMVQTGMIAPGACTGATPGACLGRANLATGPLVMDQTRVTLSLTPEPAGQQLRPLAVALATMQLVETVAIILYSPIASIHFMQNLSPNPSIILWMCLHPHLYTWQVGHLRLISPLWDLPTVTHL